MKCSVSIDALDPIILTRCEFPILVIKLLELKDSNMMVTVIVEIIIVDWLDCWNGNLNMRVNDSTMIAW